MSIATDFTTPTTGFNARATALAAAAVDAFNGTGSSYDAVLATSTALTNDLISLALSDTKLGAITQFKDTRNRGRIVELIREAVEAAALLPALTLRHNGVPPSSFNGLDATAAAAAGVAAVAALQGQYEVAAGSDAVPNSFL